jgi:TRAP-type mannitol/chloroaromatic compound transport system permease small subunit
MGHEAPDMSWRARLDRLIAALIEGAQWLALPLILLLFLQWPLRDFFRSFSREANDLGQIFFALFVAVSVTAASRAGTHLAADAVARRYPLRLQFFIKKIGALVGLVPWALFMLIASKPIVISSLQLREMFPDTGNPGYFVIKLALWIMAGVILAQALLDIARPIPQDHD